MFFTKKNTYKFTFDWKFDINFLKSVIKKNDENYTSQVFKFNEKFWYSFTLKPNENGAIWIYFNCFSGYEKVEAALTFKFWCTELFSTKKPKLECNFASSGSKGIELIDHKKLLGYKNSNNQIQYLYIKCNVSIILKPYSCGNCFLGKKLYNSEGKDIKIVCADNKEIMAHKTILETFSPIFAKMIEAQNHENDAIIEIRDCDFEILKNAINFCYGFFEQQNSDIDKMIKMLEFSDKYEMTDLKKEIEFKLMPQITNINVCQLSNAAIEANADCLKSLCRSKLTQFVKENDEIVIKNIETLDKNFVKEIFQNIYVEQGSVMSSKKWWIQCGFLITAILILLMLLACIVVHAEEKMAQISQMFDDLFIQMDKLNKLIDKFEMKYDKKKDLKHL